MERQVFQTDSRRRWRRFKWTMRFFATIFILLLAVFITMFAMEGSPNLPFRHDYRSAMTASKPFMKDNKAARSYKATRDKLLDARLHNNYMEDYRHDHRFVGHGDKVTQKFIRFYSTVSDNSRLLSKRINSLWSTFLSYFEQQSKGNKT